MRLLVDANHTCLTMLGLTRVGLAEVDFPIFWQATISMPLLCYGKARLDPGMGTQWTYGSPQRVWALLSGKPGHNMKHGQNAPLFCNT